MYSDEKNNDYVITKVKFITDHGKDYTMTELKKYHKVVKNGKNKTCIFFSRY